jgi:hypothetical protein
LRFKKSCPSFFIGILGVFWSCIGFFISILGFFEVT